MDSMLGMMSLAPTGDQYLSKMPKLIFVVGPPHSGTTLLATILGSNSECFLIPSESAAYCKQHINTLRKPFINKVSSIDSQFVVEKTPSHIFNIEKMREDFPDAKFILILKNPLDIVGSMLKTYDDFNFSVYTCSDYLSASLVALKKDIYLIQYEDIVSNFNETILNLCKYIGIEFQEKMINFHEHSPIWFEKFIDSDNHLKRRSQQMRQPLFDGRGIGRTYLNDKQTDQVMFDCFDKYEEVVRKITAT